MSLSLRVGTFDGHRTRTSARLPQGCAGCEMQGMLFRWLSSVVLPRSD
jgi:hypothetical protein